MEFDGGKMKKVLVKGPALSRSGYGEQCRFALRALRSSEDVDVYLINTGWGATGWLYEDTEERKWIDDTILKTIKKIQSPDKAFDVSLQVTLPSEWQFMARKNIGYTAGVETSSVPSAWKQSVEQMDKVIVPSNHTKDGFVTSGCDETKLEVVNYPIRNGVVAHKPQLNLQTDYNFLTVAQWSPRKNIEATITSFLEEFTNEEVGLIVKTNIKNSSVIDRQVCMERLSYIMKHFPENKKCRVYLLHGNLSDQEMAGLYSHENVNAYVTTSHGEGFGLPVFEAASAGLPVIACNWGGITDFTSIKTKSKSDNNTKVMISEVDYKVAQVQPEAVWEGVIEASASWCFPELDSLRNQMREEYQNPSSANAKKLKNYIIKNNKPEQKYKQFVESVLSVV